jgi:hypothetical protein
MRLEVSITFETVTEDSARDGDTADQGFVIEREQWAVRDVIARLRQCSALSDWPRVYGGTWASDEASQDYRTGAYYSEFVHVRRANGEALSDHQARRLFKAAGLITS